MIAQQKCRPRSDDSHDAARGADYLGIMDKMQPPKEQDTSGGANTRDQIAGNKSNRTDRSFKRWTEDVEREQVEQQMHWAGVEKQCSRKPPVLMTE